jgi:hypothetical protein
MMKRQWKTTCVDIVALFLALGLYNLSKIPFSCANSLDTNSLPTSSEEEVVSSAAAAATGNKLLVIMLDGSDFLKHYICDITLTIHFKYAQIPMGLL